MYKSSKRMNLGLLILILSIAFISPITVDAKQSGSANNSAAAATKACENALFDGTMITYSEDATTATVKVKAKEGRWAIKYYVGNVDDLDYSNIFGTSDLATPGTALYNGGGDPLVLTFTKTTEQQKVIVFAELQGNTQDPPQGFDKNGNVLKVEYKKDGATKKTTCRPGTIGVDSSSKISISGTGAVMSKTIKALSNSTRKKIATGSEEDKECTAMKLGRYKTDLTEHESDLTGDALTAYNHQMTVSFPFCYGGDYSSQFDITAKTIKKVRQKSLTVFKQYYEFEKTVNETNQENSDYNLALKEINDQNYKKVTYEEQKTKVDDLYCGKKQSSDKTVKYFTRTEEVNNDYCKVDCQEQIQITYSPPVASKAGLCFQYKVTVMSKVTCKAEKKGNITWPTPPDNCEYAPICGGDENETQAGPSEKFDSCINSCDGGKYTQSCINKCYTKVYKKSKNTKNSVKKTNTLLNSGTAQKLAKSTNDPYYADPLCDTNAEIKTNIDHCTNFFYKVKQKYQLGYYSKAPAGSPEWLDYQWTPCWSTTDSGKCYYTDDNDTGVSLTIDKTTYTTDIKSVNESVKRASPYYFRDTATAKKTLQSLWGENNGNNGYGTPRQYIIDNNGIKRQYTDTYQCYETCGYIKVSSTECVDSDKEVRDHYIKALEEIEAKVSGCNAAVVCKEDTAEFEIEVDNSNMNDTVEGSQTNWKGTNKSMSNKTYVTPSGDIKMFIPLIDDTVTPFVKDLEENANGINGDCYGRDHNSYWQHYKTTITFPGTWIDLKTGKRYYHQDEINENYAREKENYYCVGYDFESVNEKWWHWKINKIGNIDNINIDVKDNIKAKISDFGKYNWQVNVNCFYALSNKVVTECEPGDEDCPDTTKTDECSSENSTELCNTQVRPISRENIFPASDGTSSRPAGFNWTSDATDKTISSSVNQQTGYGIDPGEYAEELERVAQSNPDIAYTGDPDYEIYLTKENIKELRNYVEENGYTSFKNSTNPYKAVDGVTGLHYYTSNMLQKTQYVNKFTRKSNILGVNND